MSDLTNLTKELNVAKQFKLKKVQHKNEWIGIGYAGFLLRLYIARSKKC